MKHDSICYETTGFGFFFLALGIVSMQAGVLIFGDYPIIRPLMRWCSLPLAILTLPWTARRGIFTREGLTLRWGRLIQADYSWNDLLWETNCTKKVQSGSFKAYLYHKQAPNRFHPFYTFFFMMEGADKGYLLRAASGRQPDKGVLPGTEREVIHTVVLSAEERRRCERKRTLFYYLMSLSLALCLVSFAYFIRYGEGTWRGIVKVCLDILLMVGLMMWSLLGYTKADEMLIEDAIYRMKKEENCIN